MRNWDWDIVYAYCLLGLLTLSTLVLFGVMLSKAFDPEDATDAATTQERYIECIKHHKPKDCEAAQ